MIKIVLLLLLFLLFVSAQREGLRNYMPLTNDGEVYGVNVIRDNPGHIFNKIRDKSDALYQSRFEKYLRSDIVLDMQYFNNTSYLLQKL